MPHVEIALATGRGEARYAGYARMPFGEAVERPDGRLANAGAIGFPVCGGGEETITGLVAYADGVEAGRGRLVWPVIVHMGVTPGFAPGQCVIDPPAAPAP